MSESVTKSRFIDLEIWKKARELRLEIRTIIKVFPIDEKYRLIDQMVRCSRSVTNNIAEGYGRYHYQENIQFCRQARGSLFELIDHLIISSDENYINKETFNNLQNKVYITIKILNGYISYLKNQKELT
ncbi:MAG: four helix bundle protein [Ignavibacteria bacterium]